MESITGTELIKMFPKTIGASISKEGAEYMANNINEIMKKALKIIKERKIFSDDKYEKLLKAFDVIKYYNLQNLPDCKKPFKENNDTHFYDTLEQIQRLLRDHIKVPRKNNDLKGLISDMLYVVYRLMSYNKEELSISLYYNDYGTAIMEKTANLMIKKMGLLVKPETVKWWIKNDLKKEIDKQDKYLNEHKLDALWNINLTKGRDYYFANRFPYHYHTIKET
jgi:hypothetical protein